MSITLRIVLLAAAALVLFVGLGVWWLLAYWLPRQDGRAPNFPMTDAAVVGEYRCPARWGEALLTVHPDHTFHETVRSSVKGDPGPIYPVVDGRWKLIPLKQSQTGIGIQFDHFTGMTYTGSTYERAGSSYDLQAGFNHKVRFETAEGAVFDQDLTTEAPYLGELGKPEHVEANCITKADPAAPDSDPFRRGMADGGPCDRETLRHAFTLDGKPLYPHGVP